jgi:hypothetical protein
MTPKMLVGVYLIVLAIVAGLYVFSAGVSAWSKMATPGLENAIPVFVDLIKVVVGAAIGAASTAFTKTE